MPNTDDRPPRDDRRSRGPARDRPDDRGPSRDARPNDRDRPNDRGPSRNTAPGDRGPSRPYPADRGPARDRPNDRGPSRNSPSDRARPFAAEPRRDDRPPISRDEPRPEIKICGVNACLAVAERRPDDVRRVYVRESLMTEFGAFLRRCAANKIAYHVVEDLELEKITHSTHHEGVCFIVRERAATSLRDLLAVSGSRCLVYLDGVQNPHNLGAIVRVCAHFGATAVLAAGADDVVSTAMLRTAEGGGEFVDVLPVATGPEPLLAARAAGYRLVATAARAAHDLHARRLPARTIIMLGSETHGLSPALQKLADESVRIPGTGRLDSLNVACACSVLLSEYWRAHPGAAPA